MIEAYRAMLAVGVDPDDAVDLLTHYLLAETTAHLTFVNGHEVVKAAEEALQ